MADNERIAITIGELLARDGGSVKTGPFGTTLKAAEYSREGVPVISVGEVGYGDLRITASTPRAPRQVVERLPEYVLDAGDIVFGRKGAVDRSAMVKAEQAGWFLGSDGIRLRLPPTCDARFIAYQLQGYDKRSWLLQHAGGTTMASLNQGTIERVPVVLPPIGEQRAIAHVLGALDDKIELNRRMNVTLEAIARALFKSWFVDFDPVRVKSEGRDPGLPPHLADRFPDSFEDSELGEIPKGWRVAPIAKLAEVSGGSTPSTKESAFWEGGRNHWATPKDLSGLATPVLLGTDRMVTDAGLAQIGSGLLPPGTVLLSSRAPIGYLAIAEISVAINQGFIAMRPATGVSNLFLLYWAEWAAEEIVSRANGSTFLEISKSNFRPVPVVTPPTRVFQSYDQMARPLYSRIVANERETRTLISVRDTLLPRLISGELRIADAGRVMEAAS